jgi:hypothetical protein
VPADGIQKWEPCPELQGVLQETGKDYEGSQMEVLESMKVAEYDLVDNKVIDLKSKNLNINVLANDELLPIVPQSIPTSSIW